MSMKYDKIEVKGVRSKPSSSILSSLSVSSEDPEEVLRYSTFHQESPCRNRKGIMKSWGVTWIQKGREVHKEN